MNLSKLSLLLTLAILLLSCIDCIDAAKSTGGRRRKKKAKKNGENTAEDSVVYTSEADKLIKLAEMKKKMAQEEKRDPNDASVIALQTDEIKLRKDLLRAIVNHGDVSAEKATALHLLGRNLYHQQKYELVVEVSQEIVKIHEKVDGPESVQVAQGKFEINVITMITVITVISVITVIAINVMIICITAIVVVAHTFACQVDLIICKWLKVSAAIRSV